MMHSPEQPLSKKRKCCASPTVERYTKRRATSPRPGNRLTEAAVGRLTRDDGSHKVEDWAASLAGSQVKHSSAMSSSHTSRPVQSRASSNTGRPSSRSSFSRASSSRSYASGSSDPRLERKLAHVGILVPHVSEPPSNQAELLARLKIPRASLSPSRFGDTEFEEFVKKQDAATTESDITEYVMPKILKERSCRKSNVPFNNMEPFHGCSLYNPKPDMYEGDTSLDPLDEALQQVNRYIEPSLKGPLLPNYFVEVKGPDGSAGVAQLQASYDGAVGSRAVSQLAHVASYPLGTEATSFSTTYCGGHLSLYSTHQRQGSPPRYHTYRAASYSMVNTPEDFRRGATAARNLSEFAEDVRLRVIRAEALSRPARQPPRKRIAT